MQKTILVHCFFLTLYLLAASHNIGEQKRSYVKEVLHELKEYRNEKVQSFSASTVRTFDTTHNFSNREVKAIIDQAQKDAFHLWNQGIIIRGEYPLEFTSLSSPVPTINSNTGHFRYEYSILCPNKLYELVYNHEVKSITSKDYISPTTYLNCMDNVISPYKYVQNKNNWVELSPNSTHDITNSNLSIKVLSINENAIVFLSSDNRLKMGETAIFRTNAHIYQPPDTYKDTKVYWSAEASSSLIGYLLYTLNDSIFQIKVFDKRYGILLNRVDITEE